MHARWLVLALATSACATATTGVGDDDDTIDAPVGADGTPIDAPIAIDAPPPPIDAPAVQTITLSQGPTTITADNTIACSNSATGFTAENSFYRAFSLPTHGVNTPFTATRVDVGVQSATGAGGSQPIQVRVFTVAGSFPAGVLTQIAGQSVTITNAQSNSIV